MTKLRDIELAREVGFNTEHAATNEYLHQFAERVRAEERAACADECVKQAVKGGFAADCAATIRARGNK